MSNEKTDERPERIRITFDVPERVKRALNIRAARLDISVGEVIEQLAIDGMPAELEIADASIREGKPPPKGKPGRRPKS